LKRAAVTRLCCAPGSSFGCDSQILQKKFAAATFDHPTRSVGGFGGDGSGGGSYGEPLCSADDSAQGTSPFGGTYGGVAFFSERDGLGLFVG
jgi:hypothetical protein